MHGQLAVSSGVALRQEGERLHFVALGTGWVPVAAFVLGLLGFILSVNGLVQMALALTAKGELLILGVILTTLGLAFAYGAVLCLKAKTARERLPTTALQTLAMLDLADSLLRDGLGRPLAQLSEIHFEKRFQFASSSRRLVVRWARGELDLVKGDPFGGGLWAIESELVRRGFSVR
jgi:hypothetical protein